MDIAEIKKCKKLLEEMILKSIQTFEKEADIVVEDVHLEHHHCNNKCQTRACQLSVKVEL